MKVKHDFRNGRRYIFLSATSEEETDFLRDFFKSPHVTEEQLTQVASEHKLELILSKGM